MEVKTSIDYFDKEQTEELMRSITIIFDESNRIVYRKPYNKKAFMPDSVTANGNYYTYDGALLQKSGRGRMRKADQLKIEELEEQAKQIISEMEF